MTRVIRLRVLGWDIVTLTIDEPDEHVVEAPNLHASGGGDFQLGFGSQRPFWTSDPEEQPEVARGQ